MKIVSLYACLTLRTWLKFISQEAGCRCSKLFFQGCECKHRYVTKKLAKWRVFKLTPALKSQRRRNRLNKIESSSKFVLVHWIFFFGTGVDCFFHSLTLCEATARSTKFRKLQSYKSVFYQKKEALLLITTLPCLKVFVSLITKNKSKSSWHTEKFARVSTWSLVIQLHARENGDAGVTITTKN